MSSPAFRSVRKPKLKRNLHNLGFENNLTTEFGRITPFMVTEVVPGDTMKINVEMLIRMAALYAPAFSRINCFVRFYFSPYRLVSDDYETFITGGEDGEGNITFRNGTYRKAERLYLDVSALHNPMITYYIDEWGLTTNEAEARFGSLFARKSLYDYLGFPSWDVVEEMGYTEFWQHFTEKVDMTPFQMYHLMCNEFYRDENFQEEVDIVKDGHGELYTYLMSATHQPYKTCEMIEALLTLRTTNYQKDYFTSALPWPQRGEDTTIGENDTAVYNTAENYRAPVNSSYADIDMQQIATKLRVSGNIVASVNEFRRALAVQKFKEAMARVGARYTEFLHGIFGTSPTDSKLQRPEFLGGGRVPIAFGEVLQTSETNLTPQGTYAGRGIAGGRLPAVKSRYFDEGGFIIGVLTIVPKPFYMQGWPRKYSRFDRLDFFIPQFANIGEQEILQKELCFDYSTNDVGGTDPNQKIFGYIPRYSEFRWSPGEIHGDFRQTLLDWHTARILQPVTDPQRSMLNKDFLKVDNESANRIFNYRSGKFDHFWINIYNDVRAIRPIPKFGTPTI